MLTKELEDLTMTFSLENLRLYHFENEQAIENSRYWSTETHQTKSDLDIDVVIIERKFGHSREKLTSLNHLKLK